MINVDGISRTEQALVGAVLQQNAIIDTLTVSAADMTTFHARVVLEACAKVRAAGGAFDAVSIHDHLGTASKTVAFDYLTGAIMLGSPGFVANYVEQIKAFRRRSAVAIALDDARRALDDDGPEIAVSTLYERLTQIELGGGRSAVSIAEAVTELSADIAANMGKPRGFPTGVHGLMHATGGFRPGVVSVVAARPAMGKAQPLDAKVLTASGFRRMGDIAVGDFVISSSGVPVAVTHVHDWGELECYRVTMSDGGSTECCGDHLWNTKTRSERRRNIAGGVRSTLEILKTIERAGSGGSNHSIQMAPAAMFSPSLSTEIDPYLLGVYLGDGHSRDNVMISNAEADVVERFRAALPDSDELVHAGGIGYRVKRAERASDERGAPIASATLQALRKIGLAGLGSSDKFVPNEYLMGSIEARTALLRGLFDTDGYVTSKKLIEFSTTSPRLRDAVVFLVGSLGGIASCSDGRVGTYRKGGEVHHCQTFWRVNARFPGGEIVPVSSEKHLAKFTGGAMRTPYRYIQKIEPIGKRKARCITVRSNDGLYVTDDFIVTHNSSFGLAIAKANAQAGNGVHVFTLEDSRDMYAARYVAGAAEIRTDDLYAGRMNRGQQDRLELLRRRLAVGLPWLIDESNPEQPEELVRRVRASAVANNTKIVIVDYLQIVASSVEARSEHEAISKCMHVFQQAAKRDNLAYIVMCQLNRNLESRDDKRPQLSDLRASGSIEERAKFVIGLYRGAYYSDEPVEGIDYRVGATPPSYEEFQSTIKLCVLKNSTGPDGFEVNGTWRGEFCEIT